MSRIVFATLFIFLAGCNGLQDKDAECSDITLEVVGNISLLDEYIEGPFWGGRGPYGSAIAVVLKVDPLVDASTRPLPSRLVLYPLETRGKPVDNGKARCNRQLSSDKEKVVCDVDLSSRPVFLRLSFDIYQKDERDMSAYIKLSEDIAEKVRARGFKCRSSKKWEGI